MRLVLELAANIAPADEVDAVRVDVVLVVLAKYDLLAVLGQYANVQSQGLQLLEQHLERFRHARGLDVIAANYALIGLDTAYDVVRLDGKYLLEGVRRAIGFERPNLHLAEALSAELRLAAQRLLSNKRVRSRGPCVNLIVHQMMQLQVVHISDGYAALERFARAPVVQCSLAVLVAISVGQQILDILLGRAVEYGGRNLDAKLMTGHAQMQLKYLTDVHTRRHAQGVQNYLKRCAVGQEGHILFRQYARNDALVAVTSRHLVAYRDLALLSYVHPDHLIDAG